MKKLLIVVDMQKDFIDGALGSPAAQKIVPAVKDRIAEYIVNGDAIIYTKDTHDDNYINTNQEVLHRNQQNACNQNYSAKTIHWTDRVSNISFLEF